jgi:hypothetical protein
MMERVKTARTFDRRLGVLLAYNLLLQSMSYHSYVKLQIRQQVSHVPACLIVDQRKVAIGK